MTHRKHHTEKYYLGCHPRIRKLRLGKSRSSVNTVYCTAAWPGQGPGPERNTVAPYVRMQSKRLRWRCDIYGASKDKIVVRVIILTCYLTSMDVISAEDKERWMSCRPQQSILTWIELHTVVSYHPLSDYAGWSDENKHGFVAILQLPFHM